MFGRGNRGGGGSAFRRCSAAAIVLVGIVALLRGSAPPSQRLSSSAATVLMTKASRQHLYRPHQSLRPPQQESRELSQRAAAQNRRRRQHSDSLLVASHDQRCVRRLPVLVSASSSPESPPPSAAKKVFVAGATGALGSRIVAELLNTGSATVVAGVRNPAKMTEKLREMASEGRVRREFMDRLETVKIDLEQDSTSSIQQRMAGCGTVVSAIGASETNFFDTTAPQRIDGDGTIKLAEAAKAAGAEHMVMISSLGTGDKMFTFPAGLLNLFWGVLFQKKRAEDHIKNIGLDYTIIRPGGMERPQDDFKYTHNLEAYTPDSLSGGVVSRRQVAEFATAAVMSPEKAKNNVFEVIAQTPEFAPNRTMTEAMEAVIKVVGIQG